jgi:branched-chain amino acid transport system ATP-binding protein
MKEILSIRGIGVSYGSVEALHDVSLNIAQGEMVTLIGANGAGKSTVLKVVSGMVRPTRGEMDYDGVSLLGLEPHGLVAKGLVHCPEGRGVFPDLTVMENLDLGAFVRRDRAGIAADLDHVFALFSRLKDRRRQRAGTLSGGEQQMLAMGRSLMSRPRLLLLDEPSLGLAPQMVEAIFSTIKRINKEGVTILLVEQNAHMALETASRAAVMEAGRVILEGSSESVRQDARVRSAYLGEQVGS